MPLIFSRKQPSKLGSTTRICSLWRSGQSVCDAHYSSHLICGMQNPMASAFQSSAHSSSSKGNSAANGRNPGNACIRSCKNLNAEARTSQHVKEDGPRKCSKAARKAGGKTLCATFGAGAATGSNGWGALPPPFARAFYR